MTALRWQVFLASGLCLSLSLSGCSRQSDAFSKLFMATVADTSGLLRGFNLGEPMDSVRSSEPDSPTYVDNFGLGYKSRTANGELIDVAYWRSPLDSAARLSAITVNVEVGSEPRAKKLMDELSSYYQQRFRRSPEGGYGNYRWAMTDQNLLLELKFENLKRDITLSLTRLQTATPL